MALRKGAFADGRAPTLRISSEESQISFEESDDAPGSLGDLRGGARFRAGLEGWRQGLLSGWAVDLAAPSQPLALALEFCGRTIAETATGAHRRPLADALPGNVAGFAFDLTGLTDAALTELEGELRRAEPGGETLALRLGRDGPRVDLSRRGLDAAQALADLRSLRAGVRPAQSNGSAFDDGGASDDLDNLAGGARYRGGFEGLFGAALKGWAVDLKHPAAPVEVKIEAEGRVIATARTSEPRADLASRFRKNVAGFAIDLAALPRDAIETLLRALSRAQGDDGESPLALRIGAEGARIALNLLRPAPEAEDEPEPAAPAPDAPALSRDARALRWLVAHVGGDPTARPARAFAAKLNGDIARSPLVAEPVKRHAAEIAPLFDPFFYLDRLPHPEEAVNNPLLHYTLAGWRDGVAPSPLFAPDHYRRRRGAFAGDPLLDFVREGARLGADPHPLFDVAFYRARWLAGDEGVNPLAHYLDEGGRRRLDPCERFRTADYLAAFGLAAETETPLEAYLETHAHHEFALLPAFDSALYRYQLEVERGEKLHEPPPVHYLARGWLDETLLPNLLFDPAFYREENGIAFDGPALLHYLAEGEAAGLACHPLFSPMFYNSERDVEGGAGALEHALAHPGAHRTDPRLDAPIDARLFALVRDLAHEDPRRDFDIKIYRDANPDLTGIDDAEMERHFRKYGAAEGRLASLGAMMRLTDMRVRDLPLGFVLDDYVSIYSDLKPFRGRFVSAIYHWGRFGRQERRLTGKWLFRLPDLKLDLPSADAPLHVAASAERIDVCILIHVYYADLMTELVAFAQNFREVTFDVFINLVDLSWSPEIEAQVRAICPGAFLMISNDLGRDVGGFTRLLEHVDIGRYDLFAFLHSKKSPHIAPESGEFWRRALLSAIAGSPEIARDCVALFRDNPLIGMVGAKAWRSEDMGRNVEQYERLLDLLGVGGANRRLDYLSGFMFLIRADIVARLHRTLRKLDFEDGADKDLNFHLDGQLAHGVERATPALVREMGYDVHWR